MYSEVKINLKKLRHLTPDSITDGKGTKPGDSALVVVGGEGEEWLQGSHEQVTRRTTSRMMGGM